MAKYKVLAIINNKETRLDIRRNLIGDDDIALVGFAEINATALTKIAGYAPHVVLLVQENGDTNVMEIAERIYQGFPGCGLVLLTSNQDIELMGRAMEAGIRHVLLLENISNLKKILIQTAIFEQCRSIETGRDPKVISVYGASGGSGKTTIATNLAIVLAQNKKRVAFIDLCLCYGDAALLFNINAKETISELVQEKNDFNIDDIKSFSMLHSSGVSLLCAPASPKYAEYVIPEHVESLINTMRPYYDFVIIDLPCELTDCTLTALESSDDILLVAKRDIQNLSSSKLFISILSKLQQKDKVKLLINADQKNIIKNKDFQRVLEMPVSFTIPEDNKTTRLSQERGIPFVMGMPGTSISRGIKQVSKHWLNIDRRKNE